MLYTAIPQALNLISDFCQGDATLLTLALELEVPYHLLETALLRMGLITVDAHPIEGLTSDTLTHAILFYYLLLASGKRGKSDT